MFDTLLRQWIYDNALELVGYDYKDFYQSVTDTYAALQDNISDCRVPDSKFIDICWDVFKNTHTKGN